MARPMMPEYHDPWETVPDIEEQLEEWRQYCEAAEQYMDDLEKKLRERNAYGGDPDQA